MKYKILLCLIIVVAMACNGSHFRKSIKDDGNTLTIEVDVKNEKQSIQYKQSFDIKNMTDSQKKELEKHIYDSLGVGE